jgi:hypothetical protein
MSLEPLIKLEYIDQLVWSSIVSFLFRAKPSEVSGGHSHLLIAESFSIKSVPFLSGAVCELCLKNNWGLGRYGGCIYTDENIDFYFILLNEQQLFVFFCYILNLLIQ